MNNNNYFERHHAGTKLQRKHSQTPASFFLAQKAKNKLAGTARHL